MATFNKIKLPGYLITAKLINHNDEKSTRRSLFYFDGTNLDFFIEAKADSKEHLVPLEYEWRWLRFDGVEYRKMDVSEYDEVISCLVPYYPDKLSINFVNPAGKYKLQLKILKGEEVITYPEWRDLASIPLLDRQSTRLTLLIAGATIIGAIIIAILELGLR